MTHFEKNLCGHKVSTLSAKMSLQKCAKVCKSVQKLDVDCLKSRKEATMEQGIMRFVLYGTRTRNLRIRSPARYPLRQ